MTQFYAVIEAGGTKFNCAIINHNKQIVAQQRVATTVPKQTLAETVGFFKAQRQSGHDFAQLGLACFGPVDVNPNSATYGHITKTPKPDWSHTPILSHLSDALDCQIKIDTDVNAAALAEYRWGAAQNTSVSAYVTVGTGVGVGFVINGQTLQGLLHPEVGHMLIPAPDGIAGQCPFHGNCVEGLASGRSLAKIWGQPAEQLADDHRAWHIQADVMAKFCHNLLVGYSPQKIVIGGGVMAKPGLLSAVIAKTRDSLADYLTFPEGVTLEQIICTPGLGGEAGMLGALALVLDE